MEKRMYLVDEPIIHEVKATLQELKVFHPERKHMMLKLLRALDKVTDNPSRLTVRDDAELEAPKLHTEG